MENKFLAEATALAPYLEEIYKRLTNEEIIAKNSIEISSEVYNENQLLNGFDIKAYAEKENIKLDKYVGKTLRVLKCKVENFANENTEERVYIFNGYSIILEF